MLETSATGAAGPRAFLRVGGISVARQQLALALALDCKRIVCIARGLPPELVDVQHAAERAGAQFNAVPGARQLVGQITAADDVILIGDGLFAGIPEAAALLEKGPAVLVQPIEQGLAAGFERIDLNAASGGAMRVPGRLVERLAELPDDCDAYSALQRIALQAGVNQRAIPAAGAGGSLWVLVRGEDEAHTLEPRWIRDRIASEIPSGPGQWLARGAVRSFGPALLHAGSGSGIVIAAAVVLAAFGLGAGWFGLGPFGLALCGLGWLTRQAGVLLGRIEQPLGGEERLAGLRREIYGWGLDAVIVVITAWSSVIEPGQGLLHRFFPPLMLIALLRILPRLSGQRWAGWLEDRLVLGLVLGAAVLAGVGSEVVHGGALFLALVGIALPRAELRLTRP